MDQGSYEYPKLAKDYDNFTAPGFEISLGGSRLSPAKQFAAAVEVDLSAEGRAGGCSFTIESQYDYEHSEWLNGFASKLKPGQEILIRGGYGGKKKELFYGYVDDYTIEYTERRSPRVTVCGLDGLGYLMSLRQPLYAGKQKPREIVTGILNKSVSAGFARSVTVGNLSGFQTPLVKEQIDDWKYLNLLSGLFGMTLFAVNGELIFDAAAKKTSPILTLTTRRSLLSFEKRVSLARQVGKVVIKGRDVNQLAIKGEASRVTIGSGKSAAELVPALKDAVLEEESEFVRTGEECAAAAQNRLNGIAMGFVQGSGSCVGIPELIPGRYVKIVEADDKTNGSYFLTRVRHLFTPDGYRTEFEFRGAKA